MKKKNGKKVVAAVAMGTAIALTGCTAFNGKQDVDVTSENFDPEIDDMIEVYGPAPEDIDEDVPETSEQATEDIEDASTSEIISPTDDDDISTMYGPIIDNE